MIKSFHYAYLKKQYEKNILKFSKMEYDSKYFLHPKFRLPKKYCSKKFSRRKYKFPPELAAPKIFPA